MKHPLHLLIQSYVDGELSDEQSREVRARLDRDPEAAALMDALSGNRRCLKDHGECARELPVPQGAFWRVIENQIEELSADPAHDKRGGAPEYETPGWPQSWKRLISWLAPALAAVVLSFVAFQQGFLNPSMDRNPSRSTQSGVPARAQLAAPSYHEIDSAQDDADFISFRSESEGMSVVWISNY